VCIKQQGDQIKRNEKVGGGGGTSTLLGEGERYIQGLAGNPEETVQIGRPRHRWEDNIRKDLKLIC
jgi:hypothetical protein